MCVCGGGVYERERVSVFKKYTTQELHRQNSICIKKHIIFVCVLVCLGNMLKKSKVTKYLIPWFLPSCPKSI